MPRASSARISSAALPPSGPSSIRLSSRLPGHRRTAGQRVFGALAGTFVSNTFYENYTDLAKGRPPNRVMSPAELAAFNALAPPGLIEVISRDITTFDAEMSVAPPNTATR